MSQHWAALGFNFQEIIDTEKRYIEGMEVVVNGWIPKVEDTKEEMPENLRRGVVKMVFGNIRQLYEHHLK